MSTDIALPEQAPVRHFQRSESIAKLAEALAKAQGQIKGAAKDSANPFFKSRYADLASVMDACREPLAKNGLAILQFARATAAGIEVETALFHASGESVSEVLSLPVAKYDAQGIGSAITYARRYALAAIVGVCPEDDDGNAATASSNKLRNDGLKILNQAYPHGLEALELAWKVLSHEMKAACQHDLPALKEKAAKVPAPAKREPGEEG